MTEEQKGKITALRKCTFVAGSYDKRFVRDMTSVLDSKDADTYELSEKQSAFLDKIFYRYRRQHGKIATKESDS